MNAEMEATVGQWLYVCCYCIVEIITRSGVTATGPECARMLVDPLASKIPRLAENETKRKERWRVRYRNRGRCVTTFADLEKRGKL